MTPDWTLWVEKLRSEEPTALAILLIGRWASGNNGPYSDVDIRVITEDKPKIRNRSYIEENGQHLVRFSVVRRSLSKAMNRARDAARWPKMRRTYATIKMLWGSEEVIALLRQEIEANAPLGRPYIGGLPKEFDCLIANAAKVKNAHVAGDYAHAAFFARAVAHYSWKILHCCSSFHPTAVERPQDAIFFKDTLTLNVPIPGYRAHIERCLGLRPVVRNIDEILQSSVELALSVVEWLKTILPELNVPISIKEELQSGKVERYLLQLRPQIGPAG